MPRGPLATSEREVPLFFGSGGKSLFGVLTEPTSDPVGTVAIYLKGGSQGSSAGRNQIATRINRRLAASGFHSLRFDYHGVGDSTGKVERFRLDRPFVGDLRSVVDGLVEMGLRRFALIGSCFGAQTALACAGSIEGLVALVVAKPPLRDLEKDELGARALARDATPLLQLARRGMRRQVMARLLQGNRRRGYARLLARELRARSRIHPSGSGQEGAGPHWLSPTFLSSFEVVVRRGIPVLILRGTEDRGFGDFDRALSGSLGQILNLAPARVDVEIFEGRLGALSNGAQQDRAIELIATWLEAAVGVS